jgi:hypothetical protein
MAGHDLIDGYDLIKDYLAALARRLPPDAVDELADGLVETYRRHRSAGLDPAASAATAVEEFGAPDVVVAAFVRQAPGRRVARLLLCWGPAVGLCWGSALLLGHWPVPVAVRLAVGLPLLSVVAMLLVAATGRRSYRRTRLAAAAGIGVVGLDGALLLAVALTAPPFTWPLALAAPASLTRLVLTARAVPRLLAA